MIRGMLLWHGIYSSSSQLHQTNCLGENTQDSGLSRARGIAVSAVKLFLYLTRHNEHLPQEGTKLRRFRRTAPGSNPSPGTAGCLPSPTPGCSCTTFTQQPDRAQYHRFRLNVKSVQGQIPTTASFYDVKINQQNWLQKL